MLVFYLPFSWAKPASAIIFALAAITDWFDGYLARKLGQQSALGAFLDPVADKLIVAAALVMLVAEHPNLLMVVCGVIIIGREITISALREWMAEVGKRSKVAVSMLGKLKTTVQMVALLMLLYQQDIAGFPVQQAGMAFLVLASFLTLLSMGIYLRAAWGDLAEYG